MSNLDPLALTVLATVEPIQSTSSLVETSTTLLAANPLPTTTTLTHDQQQQPPPPPPLSQEKKNRICVRDITPELWIHLSNYLPSVGDFVRIWIVLRLYREELPKSHATFWQNLLQQYLLHNRHQNMEAMNHVAHLISYYRAIDRLAHDSFHFLRILFQKSKCNRSGCYRFYRECDNSLTACAYHPGKYVHRRYMSCCRVNSFKLPGCKTGYHDGTFYFMLNLQRLPTSSHQEELQNHTSEADTVAKNPGGDKAGTS